MLETEIKNPWSAPVRYIERCVSTMDEARLWEKDGAPNGAVIASAFQKSGRGRGNARKWNSDDGKNLLFTVILRFAGFESIPQALSLRAGLAVHKATASLPFAIPPKIKIKWPNDIMLNDKKVCGILTECDGNNALIGIGLNVLQENFSGLPGATSIMNEACVAPYSKEAAAHRTQEEKNTAFIHALLERILLRLYEELKPERRPEEWRGEVNERLFMEGEKVVFHKGGGKAGTVKGILNGISETGAVIISPYGEAEPKEFYSGELRFPS